MRSDFISKTSPVPAPVFHRWISRNRPWTGCKEVTGWLWS